MLYFILICLIPFSFIVGYERGQREMKKEFIRVIKKMREQEVENI